MSINLRCCLKDHLKIKRKCEKCGKSFTKFVVRVKNPISGKWKTKTVHNMKLAQEVEAKFKTEVLEGNLFNKKKTGEICFEHYLEYAKIHKKSWVSDKSRWYHHVNDSDYLTRYGIVKILSRMKKGGLSYMLPILAPKRESVKLAVKFGVTDVNALVAKRYLDFRSMVPALFLYLRKVVRNKKEAVAHCNFT